MEATRFQHLMPQVQLRGQAQVNLAQHTVLRRCEMLLYSVGINLASYIA